MSRPQPPKGNTPPKFRVLAPEVAQSRSKPSPSPSEPAAASSSAANPQHQSHPHPSNSNYANNPKSRPSFFTRFQQTYTSLPRQVRTTARVLRFLVPAIPIGIFFSEHVFQVMWVRGPSMTPYLNEDYERMHTKSDMVLVNMWPWGGSGWPWERKRRLERGMVVTFRSPANPTHTALKRVVGLPGDRITTRDPCMKSSQIVPFNHVWLEGDAEDPRKSLDSNTYGPVSVSLITGRVMAVLWPRWRWLKWADWERGVVEGGEGRFGGDYRRGVRERVLKEAVKMERPMLE